MKRNQSNKNTDKLSIIGYLSAITYKSSFLDRKFKFDILKNMNYLNVLAIIIIKNWPCIYKYADIDNHEVTILTLPDYQTKACW